MYKIHGKVILVQSHLSKVIHTPLKYDFIIVLSGSPNGGQVITMPDPVTGQLIPHMIQTTIDPKTGKSIQVVIPLQGGVCRGNVYTQRD